MNEVWNLDPIYEGFNDPAFEEDIKALRETVAEYAAFAGGLGGVAPVEGLRRGIALEERLAQLVNKLAEFASLRQAANTRDPEAGSQMGRIMALYSDAAAPIAVSDYVNPLPAGLMLTGIVVSVSVTAVMLALTAIIAVSEARLPDRVRALPSQPERVLQTGVQGNVQVCLWENSLYLFLDRSYAERARPKILFFVTDNHGFTTPVSLDALSDANRRYSTDELVVLEVNLARFTGYVEVRYELVDGTTGREALSGVYTK